MRNLFSIALSLCTLGLACSAPVYKKYVASYAAAESSSKTPDYRKAQYWAAFPGRSSTSDSVPQPLESTYLKDSTADVFFLHPTTFGRRDDTAWNADINDPDINAKTDYTTILYQASAFNEFRIYAPRYRQAHLRAYYSQDTIRAAQALDLAYQDIKTAFQYYLDHYNHGRPIIIASHSQGSTHAKRLLQEFFDNKPLKSQLVAAYILGMAVPRNYFRNLTPCSDSTQTGCVISWRTFKNGYEPWFVQKEHSPAWVTNPLTWTTTGEYAPKSLNKGAVLKQFNEVVPNLADAQIHDNVLWIHKPHFKGSFFYLSKNYHIGDINLYYVNIRQNLRIRMRHFPSH